MYSRKLQRKRIECFQIQSFFLCYSNFQKNEFSLVDDVKLEKKACFPSKQFLFFSEFAYQFDNEGDIHEFDVKECKFKLVSYSKQ